MSLLSRAWTRLPRPVAYLLRRAAGARPRLESMTTVRTLVLAAAPVGAIVSAIIGVSALALSGVLADPGAATTVAVWWTGDVLGVLVVAPFLFAWLIRGRSHEGARGVLEIILLCLGTAAAADLACSRAQFGEQLCQRGLAGHLRRASRLEQRFRLLDRQTLSSAVDFPSPRAWRGRAKLDDNGIVFRVEVAAHDEL